MAVNQWEADKYEKHMAFVTQGGESLIELLHPAPGESIIDWGCGTGVLTARLAAAGAAVTGIDYSREMIDRASSSYPNLNFVQADGQRYRSAEPVDAIFSNAALHWMTDAAGVAASMAASLRPGGRLAVEFGGEGNIAAIREALREAFDAAGEADKLRFPWYFPSVGEHASLLERNGFRVDFAVCYDRPSPLDGGEHGIQIWFDTFANGLLAALEPEQERQVRMEAEERLRAAGLWDGERWVADYRRIRMAAVKR